MKKLLLVALAAFAAFVLLGCSGNPGAPSTAEVSKAMGAGFSAQSTAEESYGVGVGYVDNTLTILINNPFGGSADLNFTATDVGTFPWTLSGTIEFTDWYDPSSGYTLNGILDISATLTDPETPPSTYSFTMRGNLALAGGTISTLSYNISEEIMMSEEMDLSINVSGTVTADGYQFDVSEL